jgi:hypothetical protein
MDAPTSSFLLSSEMKIYESTRGYVARSAELNHCFSRVRKSLSSLHTINADLGLLSALTGTSCEILRAHGSLEVPLPGQVEEFRIGNERFPKSLIYSTSSRVCPLCYADDGISRVYWDLRRYTVCHIHNCRLISHCTHCGKGIGWDWGCRRCSCGVQIGAMQARAVSGTVERGHCGLLARATMRSLRPWTASADIPRQDWIIPLHWHLLLMEFLEYVLLPGFAEEFDIPSGRLNQGNIAWLMLKILEDQRYCLQLREAIFLYAASSPFTLSIAVRLNKTSDETRQLLGGSLEELPFPRILWDWRNERGLNGEDLNAMAEAPYVPETQLSGYQLASRSKSRRSRAERNRIYLGPIRGMAEYPPCH